MERLTQYQFNLIDINPGNILEDIERGTSRIFNFKCVYLCQPDADPRALQVATKENKETSNFTDSVASTIIVRSDSSIKTLADARGKKSSSFRFGKFWRLAYCQRELLSAGYNPDKFFSEIIETKYGVPMYSFF